MCCAGMFGIRGKKKEYRSKVQVNNLRRDETVGLGKRPADQENRRFEYGKTSKTWQSDWIELRLDQGRPLAVCTKYKYSSAQNSRQLNQSIRHGPPIGTTPDGRMGPVAVVIPPGT